MRNLGLKAFTVCLCFISVDLSIARIVCRRCEQYQICGIKTSQIPNCPNGLPCTKEQYNFCTRITTASMNKTCDRPGLFMDYEFPNKFYLCKFKNKKNLTFQKKTMNCPKNKTFDQTTMHCLTEKEKIMLKTAKKLTPTVKKEKQKFYCKKVGTVSDLYDCQLYHVCNSKLEAQDFSCPSGTYFDGTSCTLTKTKKCVQQLNREFLNKIIKGKVIYEYLKNLLRKIPPKYSNFHNSSTVIAPGVIKGTVKNNNKIQYTYYGIQKNSKHSKFTNLKIKTFEKFVETVIAEFLKENKHTLISSKLKTATEKIKNINIIAKEMLTKSSGQKLLNNSNSDCKPIKENRNIRKVTIILITQSNCNIKKSQFNTHTSLYKPIHTHTSTTTEIYNSETAKVTQKHTTHYPYSTTAPYLGVSVTLTKTKTTNTNNFNIFDRPIKTNPLKHIDPNTTEFITMQSTAFEDNSTSKYTTSSTFPATVALTKTTSFNLETSTTFPTFTFLTTVPITNSNSHNITFSSFDSTADSVKTSSSTQEISTDLPEMTIQSTPAPLKTSSSTQEISTDLPEMTIQSTPAPLKISSSSQETTTDLPEMTIQSTPAPLKISSSSQETTTDLPEMTIQSTPALLKISSSSQETTTDLPEMTIQSTPALLKISSSSQETTTTFPIVTFLTTVPLTNSNPHNITSIAFDSTADSIKLSSSSQETPTDFLEKTTQTTAAP